MFADDAKIQRILKIEKSCKKLQKDLTHVYEWNKIWQMEFDTGGGASSAIYCIHTLAPQMCIHDNVTRFSIISEHYL